MNFYLSLARDRKLGFSSSLLKKTSLGAMLRSAYRIPYLARADASLSSVLIYSFSKKGKTIHFILVLSTNMESVESVFQPSI